VKDERLKNERMKDGRLEDERVKNARVKNARLKDKGLKDDEKAWADFLITRVGLLLFCSIYIGALDSAKYVSII